MSAAPTPSVENNIVEKIYNDLFVDISDEELENRIMSVTNLLEPKFTAEVKGYLRVYLTSRPQWTQILLGRTSIYFPIFEKKIEEKGMPNDVKFISIIESALRTDARSRVGAQGLWQFMPGTAKDNRLVIDKYVDERDDPYRATDAALEYLSSLYGRYNDWALAIAAYNSGPGRVNQALPSPVPEILANAELSAKRDKKLCAGFSSCCLYDEVLFRVLHFPGDPKVGLSDYQAV